MSLLKALHISRMMALDCFKDICSEWPDLDLLSSLLAHKASTQEITT